MKSGRYKFELERFVLFEAGAGDAGHRLELDASIVADVAIERVRLVCPGSVPPIEVPQSDDGPRLRLGLREAVSEAGGPFDQATLEIDAANGDRLAFGVGHLFRPPGWMPMVVAFAGPGALPVAVPGAGHLAEALIDGFAAMADREDLFMHPGAEGWIATSHRYGLHFPTAHDAGVERDDARAQAWPLLRALTAGLLDTLDQGAPLLVHRGTSIDTDETMTGLFDALRARNRDAALLWLDPCRSEPVGRYRAGAVASPEPSLLVASAATEWTALLRQARDAMIAPR